MRSPLQPTGRQPAHVPVMLAEAIKGLAVEPGGTYVDCTLGDGGHTDAILVGAHAEASNPGPHGRVLGMDADPDAIVASTKRLERFGPAAVLVNANFDTLHQTVVAADFFPVDGVLFDFGLSSRQLDAEDRGFSFRRPGPLDMRFSPDQESSADDLVNRLPEEELANLIFRFGEEPRSRRIAKAIVRDRPLHDAQELAELVRRSSGYRRGRTHPATRTFQALRIAVNHEIDSLRDGLEQAVRVLRRGGRFVTIAYHSLEDREVKRFIASSSDVLRAVNKKVLRPSDEEVGRNPRSRSAKMRIAEMRAVDPES